MATSIRRPWLAGVLSFLVPGLGQLYNRRPIRAAIFHLGVWLLFAAVLELMLHWDASPWNIVLGLSVPVATFVCIVVEAIRDARRNRQAPPFGRWYVHLLIGLFLVLVSGPLMATAIRTSIAQAFWVPTGSMEKTILVGDRVLVDKAAFGLHRPSTSSATPLPPQRNLIVVFRRPSGSSHFGVQRIVGLPGEEIQIRDKRLFVNGQEAAEPFAIHVDPETFRGSETEPPVAVKRDNFGPYRVPEGQFFLLGDNRDNSLDSRFQGPVPGGDIVGIPRRIYWSHDSQTRRIRWSRIGKTVS